MCVSFHIEFDEFVLGFLVFKEYACIGLPKARHFSVCVVFLHQGHRWRACVTLVRTRYCFKDIGLRWVNQS